MNVIWFPEGVYPITETLVVRDGPPPTRPTAVAAGDDPDRWVNVKDFGAAGDGITDDTAAIQMAIDAVARP